MMLKLRELEEGRALEQGSGILPGLRAMVARAEVTLIWIWSILVLIMMVMVLVIIPGLRAMVAMAEVMVWMIMFLVVWMISLQGDGRGSLKHTAEPITES